jgi:hypothetical protein
MAKGLNNKPPNILVRNGYELWKHQNRPSAFEVGDQMCRCEKNSLWLNEERSTQYPGGIIACLFEYRYHHLQRVGPETSTITKRRVGHNRLSLRPPIRAVNLTVA